MTSLCPPLAVWFAEHYPAGFSEIQTRALPHTLKGSNTLILAPTGSGKTLAAFLSVLSTLATRAATEAGLPNAVCAVYVSPLRSLSRDIRRNLTGPLEAINRTLPPARQLRMEVRTGDTALEDRAKQQRRRPHLLLTTVESLSALLSQTGWRDGLQAQAVIVDEIHAFAENKRGSLLSIALERLENRAPQGKLQRIGLSATAHPVEAVKNLLCGARPCRIAHLSRRKQYQLEIAVPDEDKPLPPAGYNAFRIAHVVARLVRESRSSLIFTTTRSAAEKLGLALGLLLPDEESRIAVHHGSVDRATREDIEARLAAGEMRAVVCSSSLELGVDFDAVDHVILIGAPRGVSRTLQRLGRSGHQLLGVAKGTLVPLNTLDLFECVALRQAVSDDKRDALRVPGAPLDVLAQALVGMAIERPWKPGEAFELVRRAGPYQALLRDHFDQVLHYLAGGGAVLGPYGTYGKIVFRDGLFTAASRKVAREYYMNIGTISDDFSIRVVTEKGRNLGSVEEAFLSSLLPGEAFLMGGRSVSVKQLHRNLAIVRPAEGERVRTPRWAGGRIPLTAQLAAEELRLRRALRGLGPLAACRVLTTKWHCPANIADAVVRFLTLQHRVAPIPVDDPVQIEIVPEGKAVVLHFHVLAGRAVNRSLAWVTSYRLAAHHGGASVVANFDDHAFLLSLDAGQIPSEATLRAAFHPAHFREDLEHVIASTETLGYGFRPIAETGQLLPRRTLKGPVSGRAQTWNGSLLYTTLMKYEPDHPLVRETIRTVLEDQLDLEHAVLEATRIHHARFEILPLPKPSPFALPLHAAFNREVLLAQDPEKALDELIARHFEVA